jgi:quercetin dioxygenase-like cupin family protein
MKRIRSNKTALVAMAVVLGLAGIQASRAQQEPSVKRTVLLKQDTSVPGREAVMALVELPPGSTEGRHTHPGEVFAYVLDGTLILDVEGQPTKTVKAGEVFSIAAGQIHQGSNKSDAPVRLSAVFFVEKGKPMTTKAP